MGVGVPEEPRRRAELAGLVFLCRLWMDSSDFSTDHDRLEAAIEELEHSAEAETGQIDVIVPLRGVQLPIARLDLGGASIVRADTVDVPAEARATDGLGASPWEPTFLAVVRAGAPDAIELELDRRRLRPRRRGGRGIPAPDHHAAAVQGRRRRPRPPRLDPASRRPLAPDRHRRRSPAPGRLPPDLHRARRAGRLLEDAGDRRRRPSPASPADGPDSPPRSVARSPASRPGLERNVVVEALNDHLLALRFLLEGGGPASSDLSMRVAALCAEPERPRRGQGDRRPRDRPRARALERRARPRRRDMTPGRDRGRAREARPRDPSRRGRRPPRHDLRDDRRRDPARRRLRGRRRRRRAARRHDRVGPRADRTESRTPTELIAELDGIAAELDALDALESARGGIGARRANQPRNAVRSPRRRS